MDTLNWYDDRRNLAALARLMGAQGDGPEEIAYMLEKPQKFEDDWRTIAGSTREEQVSRALREDVLARGYGLMGQPRLAHARAERVVDGRA